jgi:phosphatidate cytidylyltransferase
VVRLISGVLLAAGFLALVWFSNATVLLVVAVAVGVLAFHEYAELMRQLGAAVPRIPTIAGLIATITLIPFPSVWGEVAISLSAVLGVAVVLIAAAAMFKSARSDDAPQDIPAPRSHFTPAVLGAAAAGFSLVYLAIPLGALVGVHIFGGRGAVLLLVFTIVVSDSAQYYSGRTFGRHPLAPRLSPKKTIEGAMGGFVAAPIFLYFAGPYLVPVVTPLMIAPLGFVLVACGIAGDLFESMIKRAADIKDSSALIPGHGGVLDRIDALLFATPPFYLFLRWVYTP